MCVCVLAMPMSMMCGGAPVASKRKSFNLDQIKLFWFYLHAPFYVLLMYTMLPHLMHRFDDFMSLNLHATAYIDILDNCAFNLIATVWEELFSISS